MMAYMAGGITRVQWVAGSQSCPYCRRLDGKAVGINTPYIPKGVAFEADGEEQRAKRPPLIPGHDVKHPPAHRWCEWDGDFRCRQWYHKVAQARSLPIRAEPNSVYDRQGLMSTFSLGDAMAGTVYQGWTWIPRTTVGPRHILWALRPIETLPTGRV